MPLVRRTAPADRPGEAGGVPADSAAAKRYPTLLEFLGVTRWPDGSPRETGTMSLFIEGGRFKASLNDRDAQMSAFLSSDTLTGLLEGLERHLAADDLEWRAWRTKAPLQRGKK